MFIRSNIVQLSKLNSGFFRKNAHFVFLNERFVLFSSFQIMN